MSGPTLAHAAGASFPARRRHAADRAGRARARDTVIGLLWDGANCNDLLAPGCRRRAAERGPAAGARLRAGRRGDRRVPERHPGESHQRAVRGRAGPRTGSSATCSSTGETKASNLRQRRHTWHHACDLLRPGVHDHLGGVLGHRSTACVNEPIDRGAGYSTFELIRAAGGSDRAPRACERAAPPAAGPARDPGVRRPPSRDYAWSTQVDAFGLEQIVQQLSAAPEPPALTWWNKTLHRHRSPRRWPVFAAGAGGAGRCRPPARRRSSTCWTAGGLDRARRPWSC